jgi:CHAD domain-containing protein
MAKRASRLLNRPAGEGARLVALTLLDAARAAHDRLADPDDVEALHDFRVALRRLRSVLRAFRDQLESRVSRKLRRRVRDLATATGTARDSEVQIAWIKPARTRLPAGRRGGVAWLLAELEARRDREYEAIRRDAPQKFARLERRLRRALGTSTGAPPISPTFAAVVAVALEGETAELEARATRMTSTEDHAEAHAARIRIKRIRYLLEPIAREDRQAARILKSLKGAQQLLGEINDLDVLIAGLGEAAAGAAAEHTRELHALAVGARHPRAKRGPRPATSGLLALTRMARAEQDRVFRRLLKTRALEKLARDVAAFAARLAAPPTPAKAAPDPEPEPKVDGPRTDADGAGATPGTTPTPALASAPLA